MLTNRRLRLSRIPLARVAILGLLFLLQIVGIGTTGYGFVTTGILGDIPWVMAGVWRLLIFVGLTLGFLASIFAARASWRRSVALGLLAMALILGFGLGAVAAVSLLLLSAISIGQMLYVDRGTRAYRLGAQLVISAAIGLAFIVLLLNVLMHFRVNTEAVYLLALVVPLAMAYRPLSRLALQIFGWTKSPYVFSGKSTFLLGAVLCIGLIHAVGAALPERYHDALAIHLMVPGFVKTYGFWSFDFKQYVWALMPMGGDWLYSASYLLGGESAAKLLNLVLFWIALGFLFVGLRRVFSTNIVLIGVLMMVSIPLAFIETASLFIENTLMTFLIAAFVVAIGVLPRVSTRDLTVTFLLLSAAISVKPHGAFMAVPLALVLLVGHIRRIGVAGSYRGLGIAVLITLIGLIPYLNAYHRTSNPVYPFFNKVFKSEHYNSESNFEDSRWPPGLGLTELYSMTFYSGRYMEAKAGAFGFQFLVFGPVGIAVALMRRSKVLLLASFAGLVYFVAISLNTQYLRYYYPVFPLLVILCTAGFDSFRLLGSSLMARVGLIVAIFVVFLNIVFLPAAGWILPSFDVQAIINESSRNALVRSHAPQRILIETVNKLGGRSANVAIFGAPFAAELQGKPFFANWYNPEFVRILVEADSVEEVLSEFSARQISFAIVEDGSLELFPVVKDFLTEHGSELLRVNQVALYLIDENISFGAELFSNVTFQRGLEGWSATHAHTRA